MTEHICETCGDHNECGMEKHMSEEERRIPDKCGCWHYPMDYTLRE